LRNDHENILETINDIVIVLNLDRKILQVNKATVDLLGYEIKELENSPIDRFIYSSDNKLDIHKKNGLDPVFEKLINEDLKEVETTFISKEGRKISMSVSASKIFGLDNNIEGIVIIARDLTDTKRSLKEKDILIKEIHHRVKNNLQLVSSLLGLQSDQISDNVAREKFLEGQNRVKMMATFYEQLYQSENIGEIKFEDYIRNIVSSIVSFHQKKTKKIQVKFDIENISMDLNTSLICGYIISELVSNSLKHAFPKEGTGEIKIELHKDDDNYTLIVQDSGIGMPKDIDFNKSDKLGLRLVNMYVEQLKGKIRFDKTQGAKIIISFNILKKNVKGEKI